jgi:hypothetical protein
MMVMAAQEKIHCHIPFPSITQVFPVQQAGHTGCACAQLIAFVCTASGGRAGLPFAVSKLAEEIAKPKKILQTRASFSGIIEKHLIFV